MQLTKNLNNISQINIDFVGGKAFSLGKLINLDLLIPEGFVLLSIVFDQFILDNNLEDKITDLLKVFNHQNFAEAKSVSEKIKKLVLEAEISEVLQKEIFSAYKDLNSPLVAVRSSAIAEDGAEHAWAGQLYSFLNIEEKDLIQKIKECYASLFSSHTLCYRFEKGFNHTHISIAVIVQKMIPAESAGVAFSAHPVLGDTNQIVIEAAHGLGDKVVSGEVNPDLYIVQKDLLHIVDVSVTEINSKQILNNEQIIELARLVIKIEKYFKFPCDIEWAYWDNRFYILQCRPITTLKA